MPLASHPSERTDSSGRRLHAARSGHVCRASDRLGPERRCWPPCAHSRHPPSRFETCLCPCDSSRQRRPRHRCTTLCTALRRPDRWPALTRSQREQSGTRDTQPTYGKSYASVSNTQSTKISANLGSQHVRTNRLRDFRRWVPKISQPLSRGYPRITARSALAERRVGDPRPLRARSKLARRQTAKLKLKRRAAYESRLAATEDRRRKRSGAQLDRGVHGI